MLQLQLWGGTGIFPNVDSCSSEFSAYQKADQKYIQAVQEFLMVQSSHLPDSMIG